MSTGITTSEARQGLPAATCSAIRAVIVRRPDGKIGSAWSPNVLRSTESEIVATAKTEADQIGGTVEIYYREDFDSYSSCELCDATYPDATAVHLYGYGFCSDECADDWASEYLEQNDQALASEGLPAASCSLLNDQPTNDE